MKINITDNHKEFFVSQNDETSIPASDDQTRLGSVEPKKPLSKGLAYGIVVLVLIVSTVAAFAWFQWETAPIQKPTVKVGVLMAFSGGSSSMGYGAMKGITLAKSQLGANNIDLIQADSKCDPTTAVNAARQLIHEGVIAIIGDGCSSASAAVLPLANSTKTVMISPSASSTSLSIPNDYFFRVIPSDNYQAAFMAQTIRSRGIQTVGVIYTSEPYGSNMNKAFQEKFEALGGKVVATASAEPNVINLMPQMTMLKNANPQAIFIAPNSVVTATAAIKIAQQIGIVAPLFGADIMYDNTVITNGGSAAEGLTVSTFPTGTAEFKQLLMNEYGVVEQLYAAPQAYDAFEALDLAINKGATTGEAIKDMLPAISFDGMSAHIQFDQNGEEPGTNYKYALLQVQQGAFMSIN